MEGGEEEGVRKGKGPWLGWGSCAVLLCPLWAHSVGEMGKPGLISLPGCAGLCMPMCWDGLWGFATVPHWHPGEQPPSAGGHGAGGMEEDEHPHLHAPGGCYTTCSGGQGQWHRVLCRGGELRGVFGWQDLGGKSQASCLMKPCLQGA